MAEQKSAAQAEAAAEPRRGAPAAKPKRAAEKRPAQQEPAAAMPNRAAEMQPATQKAAAAKPKRAAEMQPATQKAAAAKPKRAASRRPAAAPKSEAARREQLVRPRVVAIVGSQSFLGGGLAERLASDPSIERVVAIDLRPPVQLPARMIFRRVDLTRPSADQELADVLTVEGVDTVVHLAFFSSPIHNAAYAHELEAIGTLHLLAAAATAGVQRLVVQSTTTVYGAHPRNPNLLTEEHPVRGSPQSRFVNDKVEAERQVLRWAREHPEVAVAALRFAPVVGRTVKNLFERYLTRAVAPTVAGFDPLIQTLHEDDALDALELAVRKGPRGVFNVAPRGILPLSTALRLCGATPLPLPGPLAAAALQGLRASGVTPTPASMLDYLRYVWVADGGKFERELGFTPRYSTREAIVALAERARRVA